MIPNYEHLLTTGYINGRKNLNALKRNQPGLNVSDFFGFIDRDMNKLVKGWPEKAKKHGVNPQSEDYRNYLEDLMTEMRELETLQDR